MIKIRKSKKERKQLHKVKINFKISLKCLQINQTDTYLLWIIISDFCHFSFLNSLNQCVAADKNIPIPSSFITCQTTKENNRKIRIKIPILNEDMNE